MRTTTIPSPMNAETPSVCQSKNNVEQNINGIVQRKFILWKQVEILPASTESRLTISPDVEDFFAELESLRV